ncbi:mandelate racemase/muconate lactonizing enzyme family protein [Paraburkholderia xenovorans]
MKNARENSKMQHTTHEHHDGTITSVDCYPLMLPLRKPVIMATSQFKAAPVIYVRIRTQSGAEGWGEAAANLLNSGETLVGMVALIEKELAPRLIGASVFERARLSARMRASMFANGGAIAAVDMAMLDVAGRIRGVPAVELLGGAMRDEIETVAIVGGSGDAERDFAEVSDLYESGFRCFKLKVGVGETSEELRALKLIGEVFSKDCTISADANMAWTVDAAIRFTRAAASYELIYIEQPVAPDVNRLAAVARVSPIPIAVDESVHGSADILALTGANAIAGVALKTIKVGGPTAVRALADFSDMLGLSVGLAMMMESSVATAAMIHVACAVSQVDWGMNLGNSFLAEDPVVEPIAFDGGRAVRSTRPGIGIEVDEIALMRYIVR